MFLVTAIAWPLGTGNILRDYSWTKSWTHHRTPLLWVEVVACLKLHGLHFQLKGFAVACTSFPVEAGAQSRLIGVLELLGANFS